MYDKPALNELIEAVRSFLNTDIKPRVESERKLYYQVLVTANVLSIALRELELSHIHLKDEWVRLNFVQGVHRPMPADPLEARTALAERNKKLCEEIAAGRYDYHPQRAALYEHLVATASAQLEVANPDFLKALAAEDSAKQS